MFRITLVGTGVEKIVEKKYLNDSELILLLLSTVLKLNLQVINFLLLFTHFASRGETTRKNITAVFDNVSKF